MAFNFLDGAEDASDSSFQFTPVKLEEEAAKDAAIQAAASTANQFLKPEPYVVQAVDTLTAIAANNPFTLDQLISVNEGIDPDKIGVGQVLNLPAVVNPPWYEEQTQTLTSGEEVQGSGDADASELPQEIQQAVKEAAPKTDEELNTAIFDATTFSGEIATPKRGDDPLSWIAENTFGLDENDPTFRKAFKTIAGIDPKKTPWCAAFANHVLKNLGVPLPDRAVENPNLAYNYVNLGTEVYNHNPTTGKTYAGQLTDVKEGDVIVFNNSERDAKGDFRYGQGHISFVVSVEDDGTIVALGGNQGGGRKVTTTRYTPSIIKKFYKGGYTVRRIDSGSLEQTDPSVIAAITKDISEGGSER